VNLRPQRHMNEGGVCWGLSRSRIGRIIFETEG